MKEVIYEPHPVSPERKKELNDAGFRIIDERFKPADAVVESDKPKRRRRKKDDPRKV